MTPVFADTAFYVALTNAADQYHARAVAYSRGYAGRVVTTEFVLLEVANFHVRPVNRPLFAALLTELRADPNTTVEPVSPSWFGRGVELFNARPDKFWSLTDCISFLVMQQSGITHSLTGDQHFLQAGFTIEFP